MAERSGGFVFHPTYEAMRKLLDDARFYNLPLNPIVGMEWPLGEEPDLAAPPPARQPLP